MNHLTSKKWSMAIIGLSCVMVIYITGLIMMVVSPINGANAVGLANIAITFIGMLTSSAVLGQSAVDWRSNGEIKIDTKSTVTRDERIEYKDLGRAKDKDYRL